MVRDERVRRSPPASALRLQPVRKRPTFHCSKPKKMLARPPSTAPAFFTTAQPRAPTPMLAESLFSGRGFFIRASAVGNAGFDPLHIASSEDMLVSLRHAEVKHGRLAMVAAVAMPAQELFHPILAHVAGSNPLLPRSGVSPSVLNGGLEHPAAAVAIAFGFGVMMTFEMKDVEKRAKVGLHFNQWANDSIAGDMQFDPLGLAKDLPATERFELQEAEMLNGRLAMLAVLSTVAYEAMMNEPVIHSMAF